MNSNSTHSPRALWSRGTARLGWRRRGEDGEDFFDGIEAGARFREFRPQMRFSAVAESREGGWMVSRSFSQPGFGRTNRPGMVPEKRRALRRALFTLL